MPKSWEPNIPDYLIADSWLQEHLNEILYQKDLGYIALWGTNFINHIQAFWPNIFRKKV